MKALVLMEDDETYHARIKNLQLSYLLTFVRNLMRLS